jgi:hypothetical protein
MMMDPVRLNQSCGLILLKEFITEKEAAVKESPHRTSRREIMFKSPAGLSPLDILPKMT